MSDNEGPVISYDCGCKYGFFDFEALIRSWDLCYKHKEEVMTWKFTKKEKET